MAGSAGITAGVLGDVVILPYNNLTAAKRILAAHAAELACVIVEPILGSVGFVPAEREFLVGLREEAQRLGILFILDEVQSFRLDRGGALPKDFRPLHGLRHTYASMLASSGQVDSSTPCKSS